MLKRWWLPLATMAALLLLIYFVTANRLNELSLARAGQGQRKESTTPATYTLDSSIFVKKDKNHQHPHVDSSLYKTLLHPNWKCTKKTFLLVVVISKPSNQIHRKMYRNTVLSPITNHCLEDTKHAFLVGRPDNLELQMRLEEENKRYGDILQGNFIDSYENLTTKSLFLLQWSALNCPSASYAMKVDDDVFVVIKDVRRSLKEKALGDYTIAGSVFKNIKPIQDGADKWHVPNYKKKVYPTYVSGTIYVLPSHLLLPIFKAAIKLTYVRLEDVFITGIAAQATGLPVKYFNFPGLNYQPSLGKFNLAKVDFREVKSIHNLNSIQLQFLFGRLKQLKPEQCVNGRDF